MDVIYRQFSVGDKKILTEMIFALYHEDPEGEPISMGKIDKTIHELSEFPEKGRIIIFEHNRTPVGYSILINYWSNEYGGTVLAVDELYVRPEWRRTGVASAFIQDIILQNKHGIAAIMLDVMPANRIARRFYEQCGFTLSERNSFIYQCN